jgi:hypothetical protein
MRFRRWRSASIAASCVLAVVLLVTGGYVGIGRSMRECHKFENYTYRDASDRAIVIVGELCDGLPGSAETNIDVYSSRARRSTVLRFERAYSHVGKAEEAEPKVVWMDAKTVKISIATVASIRVKSDRADDVRVVYDIGRVTHE